MKVVSTTNAPAAIGPYSQALDLGNMVFVSGQLPVDPATGTMADTVEQQAAQSLANLKAILAEAGLTMSNVVSVQHDGSDPNMPISSCFLKLTLETRDAAQIEQIRAELANEGFQLVSERV